MFVFNKGYICCGCAERHGKDTARAVYKNSCICNKCYDKFEVSNKSFVFRGTKETEFVMSPFVYKDTYREIFLKFKFDDEFAAGHLIGILIEEYFEDISLLKDFDCIVPIPLSKQRFYERGYNQSDTLAQYASKALNIPINNALIRIKHTQAQSTLIGQSRYENIKGAFKTDQSLTGMQVLMFDDVVTTGSTLDECAGILKAAGAKRVGIISGAYVSRPESKSRIY